MAANTPPNFRKLASRDPEVIIDNFHDWHTQSFYDAVRELSAARKKLMKNKKNQKSIGEFKLAVALYLKAADELRAAEYDVWMGLIKDNPSAV